MAVLLAASSGCATVLRPFPTQRVKVESDPPGARVFIDGEDVGVTPMVAGLSRRRAEHGLRFERVGCLSEDYTLRRSTSWWVILTVWGAAAVGFGGVVEGRSQTVVLGPAMVIAIDWFSGAMFRLPRTVRLPLRVDAEGESAGRASGECDTDAAATAGRVPKPLSVPFGVHENPLALPGRLAADAGLRARLRALPHDSPGPPAGARPGGP